MDGPAVVAVPEEEARGWGVAFTISSKEPVAIAIDASACLCFAGVGAAGRGIVAGGCSVRVGRTGPFQRLPQSLRAVDG